MYDSMMRTFFISLLLAVCVLTLRAEDAPADAKKPTAPTAAVPHQQYPKEYQLLVVESIKSFQARDYKGAIAFVDKADAMLPPTIWTLNTRGAVAIEAHEFAEGLKYCEQALKLDPSFLPAKFNLCEIPFLQGKYADARTLWMKLLETIPGTGLGGKGDGTSELLNYRVFLTYILEKDLGNAKIWKEKIPFPSQTPAHQYVNAVWERQNGNMDGWNEWLRNAEFVWPRIQRANFVDVLIQLEWMKASDIGGN